MTGAPSPGDPGTCSLPMLLQPHVGGSLAPACTNPSPSQIAIVPKGIPGGARAPMAGGQRNTSSHVLGSYISPPFLAPWQGSGPICAYPITPDPRTMLEGLTRAAEPWEGAIRWLEHPMAQPSEPGNWQHQQNISSSHQFKPVSALGNSFHPFTLTWVFPSPCLTRRMQPGLPRWDTTSPREMVVFAHARWPQQTTAPKRGVQGPPNFPGWSLIPQNFMLYGLHASCRSIPWRGSQDYRLSTLSFIFPLGK